MIGSTYSRQPSLHHCQSNISFHSRYNLKRRVTSLPPITSEIFTEKVLQAQASSSAAATRASYERTCVPCAKTYFSENAFDNHLGSAKHRQRLAHLRVGGLRGHDDVGSVVSTAMEDLESHTSGMVSDDETEYDAVARGVQQVSINKSTSASQAGPVSDDKAGDDNVDEDEATEAKEVPLERCLFCNFDSPDIDTNVTHMEKIHGMFIPERQYLENLNGLLTALTEKIYKYHECLYCQKLKPTVFGLQTHMRDTGHCKIPFDTEEQQLEIGDFYDFRSTYSDAEDEDEEDWESDDEDPVEGGVKLSSKKDSADTEMADGEGWETDDDDDSASSVATDELTAVHATPKARPQRAAKQTKPAAYFSDYELHLASGKSVGHRSLAKYYRQNLVSHPSPAERQEQYAIEAARGSDEEPVRDSRIVAREGRERGRLAMTRANGGQGMMGVTTEKKKEVAAEVKRSRKIAERDERKFQWGVNKQNNNQKHWRVSRTLLLRFEYSILILDIGSSFAVSSRRFDGCYCCCCSIFVTVLCGAFLHGIAWREWV